MKSYIEPLSAAAAKAAAKATGTAGEANTAIKH